MSPISGAKRTPIDSESQPHKIIGLVCWQKWHYDWVDDQCCLDEVRRFPSTGLSHEQKDGSRKTVFRPRFSFETVV